MNYTRSYKPAGDWLVGTARRNPEALLVIAAGCALLLRKNSSLMSNGSSYEDSNDEGEEDFGADGLRSQSPGPVRKTISGATDYMSDASTRLRNTARSYSRGAARFSSRAQSTAAQVWRDQPLAVAGLGVEAGAALAALLPATHIEKRTFRQAGEALAEAAGRTIESAKETAGEVAERLQGGAAEMGAAGVREIARDAAQTFVSSVSGKAQ